MRSLSANVSHLTSPSYAALHNHVPGCPSLREKCMYAKARRQQTIPSQCVMLWLLSTARSGAHWISGVADMQC